MKMVILTPVLSEKMLQDAANSFEKLITENGGELILESGKLHTDCPEGRIEALQVAGRVVLKPGSVIDSIRQVKIESTGSMEASNTTFVNSGLPEGMFCGQNGNTCE